MKIKKISSAIKNKITYVFLFLPVCFSFMLTGCSLFQEVKEELYARLPFSEEKDPLIEVSRDDQAPDIIIITDDEAEENAFNNTARLSNNAITSLKLNELSTVVSDYAYAMIDDDEKKIYDEIYDILISFSSDVYISTTNTDLIDHAFTCVLMDHPEIFYVKGYSIKTYTMDGRIERIVLSGTYTMSQNEALSMLPDLDDYYYAFLSTLDSDASEYEKVKGVYEFVIRNTDYDLRAPNNQNILSVFNSHRSVCQGYAKATQYMLNRLGVFCTLAEGTVKENESHAWNIVRINGQYYHVDTTWGDASYKLVSSESDRPELPPPEINYDYLCITTDEIMKSHVIKQVVPLMECNSIESNYFVKEGLYFTFVDDEGLRRAFDKAYEDGQATITLKCSDQSVYDDMTEYLLTNQKIFRYLLGTSVSYVTVEEQFEIMFYL